MSTGDAVQVGVVVLSAGMLFLNIVVALLMRIASERRASQDSGGAK